MEVDDNDVANETDIGEPTPAAAATAGLEDAVDDAGDNGAGPGPSGGDQDLVERILGESKKDPTLRRQELLGKGADSFGMALASACAANAGGLMRSHYGHDVIVEVARGGAGGVLWESCQPGLSAVQEGLIRDILGEVSNVDTDGAVGEPGSAPAAAAEPLLVNYFGSRALRRLVLASNEAGHGGEGARSFVHSLWNKCLKGKCAEWFGTHADKVLASLVHCGVATVCDEAKQELQPLLANGDVGAWSDKFLGPRQQGPSDDDHKGRKQPTKAAKKQQQKQQQQQQQQKQKQKQQLPQQQPPPSIKKSKAGKK